MKTTHYKTHLKDPRFESPRLFCDTRLLQRNRSQSPDPAKVTCNRCRHLLGVPQLKATKPYIPNKKLDRMKQQRNRDTHFDCGAYLFCDQRNFAEKYKVGGVEAVDCADCLYILSTGKMNISEHRRKDYQSPRKKFIYLPDTPEFKARVEARVKHLHIYIK